MLSETHRGPVAGLAGLAAVALVVAHATAAGVAAHGGVTVGPYEIEVAWRTEPAIVGEANAVQVTIVDDQEQAVTGLEAGALSVTISEVGQDGATYPLIGTDTAGTYEAAFEPAVAADYTFRVTGSIRGTAVDFTVQNIVDPPEVKAGPAIDPLFLVAGGVILALVAGMAFLVFRVRPSSPGPRA